VYLTISAAPTLRTISDKRKKSYLERHGFPSQQKVEQDWLYPK
jgi:hypothetical protein